MAITDYATLKAAIVDWSKRDDLSDDLDAIIDFAEVKINSSLRIMENEEKDTLTASTSSRLLALPTGYLQMRSMDLISGAKYYQLEYVTPDSMQIKNASGRPVMYTITSQIEFDRVPDSAYSIEVNFYKDISALSSTNTTNDILTKYPDLYLSACLMSAHQFGRDWEEARNWEINFNKLLIEAKRTDRRGRIGPGARMKAAGSTP